MNSTTVDRDGPPPSARVINSPEEVVRMIHAVVLDLLQEGFSPTKIRRAMAEALKPTGKLGFLDDSSRELAEQATELILVTFQISLVAINGRNMAAVAEQEAMSKFNEARGATDPSLYRRYLRSAEVFLNISKSPAAIAEQASALSSELDNLTSPSGSRRASLPVPPWFQAAQAEAPSADSLRVAVAYAKGQLTTWRGLEPSLMRTLTMCRMKVAKPPRTPDSKTRKQPEIPPTESSRAVSVPVGITTVSPDSIPDLATPATDLDPKPDEGDSHPGVEHAGREANRTRPGDSDARQMVIIVPGPAFDGDGDGPSAPPLVTGGQ